MQKVILKDNARIGIINRGEAALRFIRAVREYNSLHGTELTTVAFYIEAEEEAPFVKMADDVLLLSDLPDFPGKQKSPYLDHELMIQGIQTKNCDSIWVGWGFVSEDAPFIEKIEALNISFMGPSSEAMALLGDKIQAKDLAETADVPILPWSRRAVKDIDDAEKISLEIGYPVIVKASNAGGGRGIRFVRTPEELASQFKSAQEETIRITGNDIVFIEALVVRGRHLEVQCLADSHGIVNTFGVRDCSVQRKNQKIIEETPPVGLPSEVLKEMEEAAQRLIRAADYVGAGTVEYLYDLNRNEYYFMEVNTRLQVEHPITETLYSVDLVKGQIDVARGKTVDLRDRKPNGAVVEVRLNAEDPDRDFSPAPGHVKLFKAPSGPGIRVDSGIEEGSEIPSDFDSMVAKIIAHAPTRPEALARLEQALHSLRINIHNGTTNRAFLLELLNMKEIKEGGVHTGFVETLLEDRIVICEDKNTRAALLAGAVELYNEQFNTDYLNFEEEINRIGRPRTLAGAKGYDITLSNRGNSYKFKVRSVDNDRYHIQYEGQEIICSYRKGKQESLLIYRGKRYNILMVNRADMLQCEVDGYPVMLESDSGGYVKSPSPSIVLSLQCKEGDKVKKGDVLVVLEAMKMEMLVESPGDGIVSEICITDGAQITAGQPLVLLDIKEQSEEEEESSCEAVSFPVCEESVDEKTNRLLTELDALFRGYDYSGSIDAAYENIVCHLEENPSQMERVIDPIVRIIGSFNAVEKLFTTIEISSESFARPVSYQEMLTHYFLRHDDKKKGLPEEFIKDLENCTAYYHKDDASKDESNRALYRIFQSHNKLNSKLDVLKNILFSLQDLKIPQEKLSELSALVSAIVELTQTKDPSTADAALYARYKIIDAHTVTKMREKQSQAIERMLAEMTETGASKKKISEDMRTIIDSSAEIKDLLCKQALSSDEKRKALGVESLGRRMNRDREFITGRLLQNEHYNAYYCESRNLDHDLIHKNITTVIREEDLRLSVVEDLTDLCGEEGIKINCLIISDKEADIVYLNKAPWKLDQRVKALRIGWLCPGEPKFYRSYDNNGTSWEENVLYRGFSPLEFRELRVIRFSNFDNKILYKSDTVTLLESVEKNNPKDKRLFALGSFSDPKPEWEDKSISRMIMFESVFMDCVFAMRSVQARYKFRLQWNRIILHNRSLQNLKLMQMQDYGKKIIPLTHDLGLEKVVVYTRRKRWSEDAVRELELNISNISQDQFTMRSRKPQDSPLLTQNNYTSKVVRARQRNMVYPYEFIRMITYAGLPLYKGFPRGDFEEFDIEVDKEGSQKVVSVKKREYGENKSNVVFGLIRHPHPNQKAQLERVIILSDPTKDLGSLAEPECRRVIGALDLAEERQIPVEWLPISSGAKIDMETGTENLDWTASALQRIIHFTQAGGEINIIVPGVNVGAQSYWNAEATMLMHTKGLLIMTDDASLLLTGKRALDFSGSVSGETNLDIGGAEKIMGPNGQSQIRARNLAEAYEILLDHYGYTYRVAGETYPPRMETYDPIDRDVTKESYNDFLDQGFKTIGDIFSHEKNPERKKPFDIRQVMKSVIDRDAGYFERWQRMKDADTSIIWETRVGGIATGMIGIESRPLNRMGAIPHDGPEMWTGGTLFPQSSKKVARGINAFSGRIPLIIMANLSGFDGSPESLRNLQLEYGAEIGRAIVNFKGPIAFLVVARYHGGAYVVFSKSLNPNLRAAALEGSFASVLGGAPAAAVVFPREVQKETYSDKRITSMLDCLNKGSCSQKEYDELVGKVYNEKQTALGQKFDQIHSVNRAKEVGSIDDIVKSNEIRPYLIKTIENGMK
ncbi:MULTISPECIES: carboxyl transferase domain-containing protein [unclassified Oceanispirochaeta]|uniref:ATP-binding protein n=1 Tax=unclassified Oceanispirochaeta TaxID=2635722 RepID=UPI000E09A830|nr:MULTISPECIES: carboxyl transferase domain-containing protein [unclassified Oceanispirochaeta]MBF9014955.1 ATP-grasp domain-containing protein [Oceanispirochaeta sp. M2]NPD71364.1 ATP-grasp domain-containing protein [Oceanispirochaeta sp. M1]RDG33329.1 ATP-grasp domain-containing protein [Oceanispirochaeta sp. M1]